MLRDSFIIHRQFHCARTKCESIETNVFAPFVRNNLKDELAKTKFITISSDASNHGNVNIMPVMVRYFLPTVGIQVKLFEFSSLKGDTSLIIANMLIESANRSQIKKKIAVVCGDNCRINLGSRERGGENNVYYRFSQWKENLIGLGCAAYIVHNGLKVAVDCLPVDIECIVVKVYSYFYLYTVRV